MRKLKFHEQKLLKKVNFLQWKREGDHREANVMRRYHIVERDDYKKYSGLCRMVQKLVNILKQMDPRDPYRVEMTDVLLEKLYNMGVIPSRKSLALCDRLSVSSFCRRRLSTVLVRLKFAEHLKEAVTYIEQGHIRVGPETVTDPAFLVTRNMEDFITWVDTSKIKRKVLEYNDQLDAPATLVSICAQSVNLLDETASLPSSFPDSLVDKFKICTDIALAIKRLGYIGDMTYYKFLYPSEEDLFKLVRFLVERLSESSVGVKLPDLKDVNSTRKIRVEGSTDNSEDWMEKADDRGLDHQQEKLKNLSLHNIGSELSDSNVEDTSFNRLLAAEGESERVAFQKVTPAKDQSSQMRHESETLQYQEKLLVKEVTARTSELQKLQEEFEMLKDAAEMAFDDQHPIEFYVEQLNKQVDSKKCNIVELESKWDAFRKPLEEKKRSLEESLYADIPEAQEKLLKLTEVELEKQAILSKVRRLEEEHSKLCVDLGKQPKLPTRTSYIERIKEITKNSRKQDADIERILKETRELQLESNSIQECLDRTYAVLDEIVFREAKKDPVGRQAYRLLTSIHECFEQISEKILMTDRIRREMAECEKKLSAMAFRSLNVDKLQADLDAITKENKYLEQHLGDD